MSATNIPELSHLLSEVERTYGRRIATSTDFEALSVMIEHQTRELISASTLKRLWGYVTLLPTPWMTTLDVLARYIGQSSFKKFCEVLKESNISVSGFFTSRCILASDLEAGDKIAVGWAPNRLVTLSYKGNYEFEVITSENSQLIAGDVLEMNEVTMGYPLVVPRILRNGNYTPSYIAGRNGGINHLKKI